MTLMSLGIGCGLAVLILTRIISSVIAKRRRHAEAARLGCKPAPALPNRGFLGLRRVLDHLKATREERGPQQFVEAFNELGTSGKVHTARVEGEFRPFRPVSLMWRLLILTWTVLGSEVLVTRDPENVKAIFVTHASSFEIGASR